MNIKNITSKQNEFVKRLYKLVHTSGSYHQAKEIWLEGEHLCQSYLDKVGLPLFAVCSQQNYENNKFSKLLKNIEQLYVLDDRLFEHISGLHSATGIGFVIALSSQEIANKTMPTIVLDRLQDPGNVGSILRTAAAFGFHRIVALQGTCALWSPKVLRAGMGAHFSLHITERTSIQELKQLDLPLITTSSHATHTLQSSVLPWPCAWVLGHEGQGVHPDILSQSDMRVCIEQPGGEESLNAAIAASICMYESIRQHGSMTNG